MRISLVERVYKKQEELRALRRQMEAIEKELKELKDKLYKQVKAKYGDEKIVFMHEYKVTISEYKTMFLPSNELKDIKKNDPKLWKVLEPKVKVNEVVKISVTKVK